MYSCSYAFFIPSLCQAGDFIAALVFAPEFWGATTGALVAVYSVRHASTLERKRVIEGLSVGLTQELLLNYKLALRITSIPKQDLERAQDLEFRGRRSNIRIYESAVGSLGLFGRGSADLIRFYQNFEEAVSITEEAEHDIDLARARQDHGALRIASIAGIRKRANIAAQEAASKAIDAYPYAIEALHPLPRFSGIRKWWNSISGKSILSLLKQFIKTG